MSIMTIREKIHHGAYRNVRIGVLPTFDKAAVAGFMNEGPHAATGYSDLAVSTVFDHLTKEKGAEWGWANYTVHEVPDGATCEWYAMCTNPAIAVANARVLDHPVPICQRCSNLFEESDNIQVVNFPLTYLRRAERDIEDHFTLVRDDNGDVKKVELSDIVDQGILLDKTWCVVEREKSCGHATIAHDCDDCQTTSFPVVPGIISPSTDILYYVLTVEGWTADDKDLKYVY